MVIKEAVVYRFKQIMLERNLNNNSLAVLAGVTPSTVYSMMSNERHQISISTIKILCDGLGISLHEFFNSKIFDELDED